MADTNETIPGTSSIPVRKTTDITAKAAMNTLFFKNANLLHRPERFIDFGDSITEQTDAFTKWFQRASKGGIVMLESAGIGGNTTQNMLDRLDDVDGATLVTVMETTNDSGTSGVSVLQHSINMKAILLEIIKKGIKPVLVLGPPSQNGSLVSEYNFADWITAMELGVEVYSIWDQFTNSVDGNGTWGAGYASDGTHPDRPVRKTAGLDLYDKFKNKEMGFPVNRDNSFGLIANPLFLGDANSDGKADGWAYGGTFDTTTLSKTSLGIGNTANVTCSSFAYLAKSFVTEVGKTYIISLKFKSVITGDGKVDIHVQGSSGERSYISQDGYVDVDSMQFCKEFTAVDDSYQLFMVGSGTTFTVDMSVAEVTCFCVEDYTVPEGSEYTVNGETRHLP